MGSWSSFSGVPAFIMASAYSFDWIAANAMARSARNGASGEVRVKRTVWSSTFSIDFRSFGSAMSLK